MKANELMIGDYIMFNKDIYKIEEISKKGWAHIIYNDESECRVALSSDYILDDITPIPLTPEILEKNGFSLQSDNTELFKLDTYWLGCELGTFRIHNLNKDWWQFGLAKIRYVHELQHAMCLCGREKDIAIFLPYVFWQSIS